MQKGAQAYFSDTAGWQLYNTVRVMPLVTALRSILACPIVRRLVCLRNNLQKSPPIHH